MLLTMNGAEHGNGEEHDEEDPLSKVPLTALEGDAERIRHVARVEEFDAVAARAAPRGDERRRRAGFFEPQGPVSDTQGVHDGDGGEYAIEADRPVEDAAHQRADGQGQRSDHADDAEANRAGLERRHVAHVAEHGHEHGGPAARYCGEEALDRPGDFERPLVEEVAAEEEAHADHKLAEHGEQHERLAPPRPIAERAQEQDQQGREAAPQDALPVRHPEHEHLNILVLLLEARRVPATSTLFII